MLPSCRFQRRLLSLEERALPSLAEMVPTAHWFSSELVEGTVAVNTGVVLAAGVSVSEAQVDLAAMKRCFSESHLEQYAPVRWVDGQLHYFGRILHPGRTLALFIRLNGENKVFNGTISDVQRNHVRFCSFVNTCVPPTESMLTFGCVPGRFDAA